MMLYITSNKDLFVLSISYMRPLVIVVVCATLLIALTSAQSNQFGYACNVLNCQTCSYINFCGVCSNNYILQINSTTSTTSCQPVTCPDINCKTCYQNNICATCNTGYSVTANGTCVNFVPGYNCSAGCLSCSSATVCTTCMFGYNLQNGGCFSNNSNVINNCVVSFTAYTCLLCSPTFMVNPSFQCISINNNNCGANCNICNSTYCLMCASNYTLNPNNTLACSPNACNIPNCQACTNVTNPTACAVCMPGYYLDPTNFNCTYYSYTCQVQNCLFCANSGICTQCAPGYTVTLQEQNNAVLGSSCTPITSSDSDKVPVTNCQQLGFMVPGTSSLEIGCILCQPSFILVGGYCMPNVLLANFTCNIPNCNYCVQNNICGQCAQGYTVYSDTSSVCTPNYSPVANCLLTPPFYSSPTPVCFQCQSGYALVYNSICMPIPSITCNVTNCNFCLTQNDTCSQCLPGYSLNGSSCSPNCPVSNCQTCSDNTNCVTCAYGYYLFNSTACLPADQQQTSYCNSTFQSCSNCSYYACTVCATGFSINDEINECCPSPVYNIANCMTYDTTWSSTDCNYTAVCTVCNPGTFIFQSYPGAVPQCTQMPCSIANCSYCFMTSYCVVCNTGFTLSNGVCTPYSVSVNCTTPYCTSCNSSNVCMSCLNGYILLNGQCVCEFQNCLSCVGSAFCTQCAFPTVASMNPTTPCLPPVNPQTLCTVANCLNCNSINLCVQCDNGFTLQSNGTCTQNLCDIDTNCLLCAANQLTCYVCNPGFLQEYFQAPTCVPVLANYSCNVSGCAVCNSQNPNQCQYCSPYYNLSANGQCTAYTCLSNCVACLSSNTCLICQIGFYLTSGSNPTCAPSPLSPNTIPCNNNISGCIGCTNNSNGNLTCSVCEYGQQPSSDGSSCVPQTCTVPNCQICIQNAMNPNGLQLCLICQQGYFVNSYFQCVSYNPAISAISNCSNIYNCYYCSYPGLCDYCAPGWLPINGTCITTSGCAQNCTSCSSPSVCYSCAANYQLVSNVCVPVCGITGCITCNSTASCSQCGLNFILTNNTCSCPTNFTTSGNNCTCAGTILNGGCITCDSSVVPGCQACNGTNTCNTCMNNYVLNANFTCSCNSPFVAVAAGSPCQCPTNYTQFNSSTCFNCTFQNCLNCSADNVCLTCINNQIPINNGTQCGCNATQNLTNNFCYTCIIPNCLTCSADNVCATCSGNLIPVQAGSSCGCNSSSSLVNSTCVSCNIPFCSQCSANNTCSACMANTTLVLNNNTINCIPCYINNCNSCSSPNFCSSCSANLTINSQGNVCLTCSIPSCSICVNANVCAACQHGYQLSTDSTACVLNCNQLQGCAACNPTGTTCIACLTGYSLAAGACTLCQYPCSSCVSGSTTACLTCQSPFSPVAFNNGTCFYCNVANCVQCSSSSPNVCTQCATNYQNSNGTCVYSLACSQNCLQCAFNTYCTQCSPGYGINIANNSQCILCSNATCLSCSSTDLTTCFVCASGYYLQGGVCYACLQPGCLTCDGFGNCLTFQTSTGLIPLNVGNGTFVASACDPGCTACSQYNNAYCYSCNTGYTLNNLGYCIPCAYPCMSCSASNPSLCLSCYGNMAFSNNTCTQCNASSNCLTCSSSNSSQCTACSNGYSLVNGVCQAGCPSNCLTCSNSTLCSECVIGFALSASGVCVPCMSNCQYCSGTAPSVCISCGNGLYLNNGYCTSCVVNCLTCSAQQCLACAPGFILSGSNNCSPVCTFPCITCTSSNQCLGCAAGYSLSNQTCVANLACSSQICYVCPLGSVISNNTCISCAAGSNCARCNISTLNQCYNCLSGYFLSGSQCTACPQGCATCSSNSTCNTCNTGYTLVTQVVASADVCQPCASPCATCMGSPTNCLSCISGFTFNGWACINNFNFNFLISFNTDLPTFWANYESFLVALVNNTANFNQVAITNMQQPQMIQNSLGASPVVNVVGTIATFTQSGSLQSTYELGYLQSTFASGATVANMSIASSGFYPNGGVIPPYPVPPVPPQPVVNNNLAIILGICIPLAVILIGVIIYFVVVRKSCQKDDETIEYRSNNTTVRETFELTSKAEPTL